MKRTKTLSFKLSLLFIGGMGFAMVAGGITTYVVQSNIVKNYTNTRLKNSVYEFAASTNNALIRAEATVEHGKNIAENFFTNKDQLYDENYVSESIASISNLYELPTHELEDVCAHYIVLNPAFTHCTTESEAGDGFFHVKNTDGIFISEPVTNILKFDENDTEDSKNYDFSDLSYMAYDLDTNFEISEENLVNIHVHAHYCELEKIDNPNLTSKQLENYLKLSKVLKEYL